MPSNKYPYISCVIPAYNGAKFLPEAVESALNQDFPEREREIIVVDDGSTDNTADILARYKGKVRSIRQRHQGQGEALRTAMQASRGEIIAELDQDDTWKPRKLSRVAEAFAGSDDIVAVSHTVQDVDARLRPIVNRDAPHVRKDIVVDLKSESVLFRSGKGKVTGIIMCAGGSSWTVKKEAVSRRLPRARLPGPWADLFYIFLALSAGGRAVRLKEKLSFWRWHKGGRSFCGKRNWRKGLMLIGQYDAATENVWNAIDPSRCPILAADLMSLRREIAARMLFLTHKMRNLPGF